MTSGRRLPNRLPRSRPGRCVETISQGYPQTTGFSSEISGWVRAYQRVRPIALTCVEAYLGRRWEKLVEHHVDNDTSDRHV
jgi:hypothetical protein